MIHILSNGHSILNQFIAEIRDSEVQRDSLRFRNNLERLGFLFAYEISKEMNYNDREVATELGIANVPVLSEYPVLATILRAGLPFHQGFLRLFDRAENAFIRPFRKPHKDHTFSMNIEYASGPGIDGRVLIISDVMIATGKSMLYSIKEMLTRGKPSHIHVASILSSAEGLDYLKKNLPDNGISYWLGVIDEELTAQAFIVPGLGDAGDLAFGKKF